MAYFDQACGFPAKVYSSTVVFSWPTGSFEKGTWIGQADVRSESPIYSHLAFVSARLST